MVGCRMIAIALYDPQTSFYTVSTTATRKEKRKETKEKRKKKK